MSALRARLRFLATITAFMFTTNTKEIGR